MQHIVKFRLTKDVISSTIYKSVRYCPRSLSGIIIFDPIFIQGEGRIAFLIKHLWKNTPSIPLIGDKLSTLQLEAARGGHILEDDYPQN